MISYYQLKKIEKKHRDTPKLGQNWSKLAKNFKKLVKNLYYVHLEHKRAQRITQYSFVVSQIKRTRTDQNLKDLHLLV